MNHDVPTDKMIFLEAVEYVSQERWDDFLRDRCGNDDKLYDRVHRLLLAHRQMGSVRDSPPRERSETQTPIASTDTPLIGTEIGSYRLREQLGEGGMGVVYVGEQTEPVRRKVALKVIKPGMDSQQVIARFESERQALAMMDHPNIARILDAGTTASKRSYFVMELVYGVPLTEYCDQHELTTEERLRIFVIVCKAVQHAHQKGIIHRDLKPSNVLVASIDGEAVPKVIDFGVAKATGPDIVDATVYTQFAQMIGTPLYMSPEQAELGVADVDTRCDVYTLGVLLYELLTGTTPFNRETLKQASFDEMRRIIRENEPLKPSSMVSTFNAEALSTISQRRSIDPRKLRDSLKGEFDWIVMKALEKDRNRRYESASALAADIERHLRDEPVVARPASRWYRAQKFIRRNRVLVASTAAVVVALVTGLAPGHNRTAPCESAARRCQAGGRRCKNRQGTCRKTGGRTGDLAPRPKSNDQCVPRYAPHNLPS